MFRDICLMQGYEDLHVFLLKNIYHQLGSDTQTIITNHCFCSWIIPEFMVEKMKEVSNLNILSLIHSFVFNNFHTFSYHLLYQIIL